jgi:sugar phosphate isomerase/epimerase
VLGTDDLILSALTVAAGSFEELVQAAAEAGCAGVGIRRRDYEQARAAGASDADLQAMLDAHGVSVVELEALRENWAYGDERATRSRETEKRTWAIADALGGTYVIATAGGLEDPQDVVAERLARLADAAAARGLIVALEFMPWTDIEDAVAAWELVQAVDHRAVGILVDSWHIYRGSGDVDQLRRIPADKIVAVHIADADAEVVGTLPEDTYKRRRVPGEGTFPLVDFVRTLDDVGARIPYAVEVLSDDLRARPAAEAARLAVGATRRVLAAARS